MAKPRIFISSTFYDLRQIRAELDKFITNLGYESVRNEEGDIPYGKEDELQKYCYREIENVDILLSIIGSRYGSHAIVEEKEKEYSVSMKELKTAYERNKHVFIFIDKSVLTEYETYLLNKGTEGVVYKYVDNAAIYKFIEEVKSWSHNNNIKEFETADDITQYLKEQFAGLFKQYIVEREQIKEVRVIQDIQETAKTLRELVDYLKQEHDGKDEEISKIVRVNHPIVGRLKELLNIPYNFYIDGEKDLKALLNARSYYYQKDEDAWVRDAKDKQLVLKISSELFENNHLKYLRPQDWKDEYVVMETIEKQDGNDDLPF